MAGPQQTRSIGYACRIYRNSSNKVLAIDEINIIANTVQLSNSVNVMNNVSPGDMTIHSRWHRQALMQHKRCMLYLGTGDRIVAKIQMIGNFKSVETISGNYLEAIWQGCDNEDDIPVTFIDLPKVGDTL